MTPRSVVRHFALAVRWRAGLDAPWPPSSARVAAGWLRRLPRADNRRRSKHRQHRARQRCTTPQSRFHSHCPTSLFASPLGDATHATSMGGRHLFCLLMGVAHIHLHRLRIQVGLDRKGFGAAVKLGLVWLDMSGFGSNHYRLPLWAALSRILPSPLQPPALMSGNL